MALHPGLNGAPETILSSVSNDEEQYQDDEANPSIEEGINDVPSVRDICFLQNPPSKEHNQCDPANEIEDGRNEVQNGRLHKLAMEPPSPRSKDLSPFLLATQHAAEPQAPQTPLEQWKSQN